MPVSLIDRHPIILACRSNRGAESQSEVETRRLLILRINYFMEPALIIII